MAKRYHQSKKDRRDESMGMKDHYKMIDKEMASDGRSKHRPDSFNDEKRSSRGNEKADYRRFKALGEEIYAGSEPRRRQEMQDAGMIYEDHRAIANLPQNVMMKEYPKTGPYIPEGLDDTIRGVDHQMDYDDQQRRAHFYPKKV